MTVIESLDPRYEAWAGGPVELGYPSATWEAAGAILGDASGGDMQVSVQFTTFTDRLSGQIFSLEQLSIRLSATGANSIRIATSGFRSFITGLPYIETWVTNTISIDDTLAGQALELGVATPHILLGQQSVSLPVILAATLNVSRDNIDTDTMQVGFRGYVWDPRATQVAGGPKRPAEGLFSQ